MAHSAQCCARMGLLVLHLLQNYSTELYSSTVVIVFVCLFSWVCVGCSEMFFFLCHCATFLLFRLHACLNVVPRSVFHIHSRHCIFLSSSLLLLMARFVFTPDLLSDNKSARNETTNLQRAGSMRVGLLSVYKSKEFPLPSVPFSTFSPFIKPTTNT